MPTFVACTESVEECAHWLRIDQDCTTTRVPHTEFCEEHGEGEGDTWYQEHRPQECCPAHCGGDIPHYREPEDL